ncbi:phage tail spike protein [Streptococcus parasanguinis]|uniref:phage tail spike protein n=1 Tax=Streptococcus parasanguinis TaxID=1318 RepID=UPI00069FB55B|nr:phage tail spike protein [Streptococcus parasanguinis]QBX27184.1 hyaluronidase [Streptococcus phage Javan372]
MKWNGQPLHESTKAEVEEVINVSYTLKVDYPITDTEIYKKFQEDMLIIAPTPVTGRQLFRIKEISEQDDTVSLTCQHITEDIFKRSVRPIKVSNSTCQIALNAMISAVKTPLGKFSFTSNIMDNRTFNTTEDETLYKILMDGKHSIVGAWEGEMIRDNFLIDIPKSRGIDRGVVITTHQNLKQYERNKSSSSIITRLHLKSTFKPEGAEEDTVLKVTVDSPLIGNYPYINEAEYENNDLTTEEELRKWGEAKFKNGNIDKPTDQIKIEAYELDGQTVHLGDTAALMSLKHDVMLKKKAVGYVYDALTEEYISLTFDDKAGHGGGLSGSNGISDVASEILDTVQKTQEDDEYYKKLKVLVDNANRAFEDKAGALEKEITDGIEQAKAQAEVVKEEISAQVTEKIKAANQANKNEIVEEFKAQYNGIEVKMEGFKATTDQLKASDADIQKLINDFKAQTQSQFVGVQGAQSRFEQTTEKAISDLTNVANGKADRSFVEQTVAGVKEEFTSIGIAGGPNMLRNSRADEGLKYWTEDNGHLRFTSHQFYFNGQKRMFELRPNAVVKSPRFIVKRGADYMLNIFGFDTNSRSFKVYFCKRKKGSMSDFEEKQLILEGIPKGTDSTVFDSTKAVKKSLKFNVEDFDEGFLQFEYVGNDNRKWSGLFMTELDFYEGASDRKWQPAPEDQNYLVDQAQATFERTIQGLSTQLTKLETKTGPSGELEQRMLTYSEKAAVDALKATRQILAEGYIAKAQYNEDVAGITRRFEDLKQNNDQAISSKIAEYKQTVDGQFTTITNRMGDMLRKTDINITDGQISFGTGKTINGRTISSLLVQEPEAIALIAKMIKVKGDMVVDGSIASRHLASQSVRTGHMEAGSVTTQILASNAVTADKLLVDYALIQKLLANQAFIRELISQKAFITELNSIKIAAERIQGGRLSANNGSTVFDLDNGTLNLFSNTGTIRRIDDTSSSQFIKFNQVGLVGEYLRDNKAARIVIGTNQDKTENTENATFAGMRLWSGAKNDVKESLYELVGDRIIFYANGQYRSPWIIHNNTKDGNSYLIPMNEKGVKHNLGRGDKHFSKAYIDDLFIGKGSQNVGVYLWDILTCFGILARYGWNLKNGAVQNHIKSNLINKYGFK